MIRNFIFCVVLLFGASSFAQSFDLTLTPTAETCYGNGAISVTANNTVAGVTVDYVLYKMPDESTPVAFGVGNSGQPGYPFTFSGLTPGDYKVVATQSLGAPIGSALGDVTVAAGATHVSPLTTEIDKWILCGEDGYITATLLQGTAQYYRLLKEQPEGSGTFVEVAGPQDGGETSSTFENLTPGQYRVVIRDAVCDNDVVITVFINPVTIGPVEFGTPEITPILADCEASFVLVKQPIQIPLIAFPVTITFTVYPPDYPTNPAVEIVIEDYPAQSPNDPNVIVLEELLPFYHGEYYYTINVTNQCGQGWSNDSGNIPVLVELEVQARLSEKLCYGLDVLVGGATGSYTVEFLDRDDYFNGIETIINVGHISDFSGNVVDAFVHSHSDGEAPYTQHPGPFPVNPMGGTGWVTYGLYDMYWLDDDGNPIYVDADGNIVADPNDGEKVPVLVGQYVLKIADECSPITGIYGYLDSLQIVDEFPEPNLTIIPMSPLPSPTPDFPVYDEWLDCIEVGGVYINHVLYFDWAEDQDGEFVTPNVGKIEIIDGPSDYQYFLANYTTDPNTGLPFTLPVDITGWVGTPASMDPNPPFPNEVAYEFTVTAGVARPLFPGLVGLGEYTFQITDICGNTWTITDELESFFSQENTFNVDVAEGCGDEGSVHITPNFTETVGYPVYTYVQSGNAPAEFFTKFADMENAEGVIDLVGPFPFVDVATTPTLGNWFYVPAVVPGDPGTWQFMIGGLPAGDYIINTKIGCAEVDISFKINGYEQELTEYEMIEYCGNFSFMFDYESNSSTNWGPIYTIERCTQPNVEDCTEADWVEIAMTVEPGVWNNGVTAEVGHYRIVKNYRYFSNDILNGGFPSAPYCEVIVHEFDYYGLPGIQSIDALACPGGQSLTIVNATGAEPLSYELVEVTVDENGVITVTNVVIDNGLSNVFADLTAGNYYFRITDNCGANVVGAATVGEPTQLVVIEDNACDGTEDPLCHGSNGCLSVDYMSIFEYTWSRLVKDANGNVISETQILDQSGNPVTGNQLHFAPYDASVDAGWYRVYFNSTDPNLSFCNINYIDYLITDDLPVAGDDVAVTYCHTNQSIDLSSLLSAGATSTGSWTDVDNTGALSGSIFNTTGIAFGTYTFLYEVGGCNGFDDATITITLTEEPGIPVVEPFGAVCPGDDLTLSIAGANPQFTYHWTLPNGNTYTGATVPLTDVTDADGGTYSVYASLGTCQSNPTSVSVVVKPLAQFSITSNTEICTTLTVVGANFTAPEATYEWTFGGAVVGTNVSLVADEAGTYTVAVTLDGCTSTQNVEVTLPVIVVNYGCVDNQFMVFVENTGDFPNATYQWTGPNFSNTGSSVNLNGLEAGDYVVTITDSQGCSVSESATITGTQCMIPKGVSPNGDDINDTFDLSNFNVSEVKIFNRYGKTVYEKNNGYTNDWYGQTTNSDKLLPTATYYYLVTFLDGTQKSGWVYLNREE